MELMLFATPVSSCRTSATSSDGSDAYARLMYVLTSRMAAMTSHVRSWAKTNTTKPLTPTTLAAMRTARDPKRWISFPLRIEARTPLIAPGSRYTVLASRTVAPKPYPGHRARGLDEVRAAQEHHEHRHADHERGQVGDEDGRVGQRPGRDEWVGDPAFEEEPADQDQDSGDSADDGDGTSSPRCRPRRAAAGRGPVRRPERPRRSSRWIRFRCAGGGGWRSRRGRVRRR